VHEYEAMNPDILAGEHLKIPPKQERGRRAREALVNAAQAEFARRGYEATTVDEIARRAGVAVGGFYRYFSSKRQLLMILMDGLLREFEARYFERTLHPSAAEAKACLYATLQSEWSNAIAYRPWREAVASDPSLAAIHVEIEAVTTRRIAAALKCAAAAPRARRDVSIPGLAAIVNALFWRMLETTGAEHAAFSGTMERVIEHALFEDGPPEAEPAQATRRRSSRTLR
jgi:AcrR family transcriptional regulator